MTSDIEALVAAHLAIWNTRDSVERVSAMPGVYAESVRIGEPEAAYTGHDGMDAAVAGLQGALPGMSLSVNGEVQQAQDMVTYRWNLGPDAETAVVTGRDVLLVDDDVERRDDA